MIDYYHKYRKNEEDARMPSVRKGYSCWNKDLLVQRQ